jgi:hypothetical protein
MEIELEEVFSMWPAPRLYHASYQLPVVTTRVEAGSNTSTVTLRVVGGDKKGSLKPERVKYGHESQGTRTGERLRSRRPAEYTKTDPSSRQRGRPTKTRP